MAKSPEEMAAAMIANLKEKTGRTLPQWLKVTAKMKDEKHGAIVKFLKEEHGLTHGYANLISQKTRAAAEAKASKSKGAEDDPVAAQYAGAKAELRPIYDALIQAVNELGNDVEISPKKTYVSLRRSKQFALVQPSTKTRVDVGIKLAGARATKRLEDAGSWNGMVTHRVRVTRVEDVDDQLLGWIAKAYAKA